MSDKVVAIKINDIVEYHLPHVNGNYYSLCGIDGNDPRIHQKIISVPFGAKINCKDCIAIYELASTYLPGDFYDK